MQVLLFSISSFKNLGELSKGRKKEETSDPTLSNQQEDHTLMYDIEDFDLSDEETDLVEDFGFGRPRPVQKKRNRQVVEEEVVEQEEDYYEEEEITSSSKSEQDKKEKKRMAFFWRRGKNGIGGAASNNMDDQANGTKSRSMFGWKNNLREEMEAQLDEIEALKERSVIAEAARERLEGDYEKVVYRLKESQKQLSDATRTNNFLKNQVKDSKNVIERVITAERQKTNAELARVRDQMVAVLERERRIMRHQLMKSSAEVRSMIAHDRDYSDYSYDDYDN